MGMVVVCLLSSPVLSDSLICDEMSQDLIDELCNAAGNGNISSVESLLSRGVDVNGRDSRSWVFLFYFLFLSHLFSINGLLSCMPPIMVMNHVSLFFSLEEQTLL